LGVADGAGEVEPKEQSCKTLFVAVEVFVDAPSSRPCNRRSEAPWWRFHKLVACIIATNVVLHNGNAVERGVSARTPPVAACLAESDLPNARLLSA